MNKIYFLTAFYAVPLVSILLFPLRKRIGFSRPHAFLGRLEILLFFPRDWVLAPFLLSYLFYDLMLAAGRVSIVYLLFVVLSLFASGMRRLQLGALVDFLAGGPRLGPEEFFRFYYSSLSLFPGNVAKTPYKRLTAPFDYSQGAAGSSFWPVFRGLFWTAVLARLLIRASSERGAEFCQRAAPTIQMVWGLAALKFSRSKLTIEGTDSLASLSGRTIFIANHKSFFDFSVIPVVTGWLNWDRPLPFRLGYMAAKDHFYDNKFLYSVVGIGRALEAIQTIFVDRGSRKKPARAAVDEAAEAIVGRGVDIVMFPQGTRACSNLNGNGRRVDAGYYTTVNRTSVVRPRGHLKKGAAHLAIGAARRLSEKGTPLHLVPVGIVNTGIVAPRGALRIQKGVEIKVIFGRPYRVESSDYEYASEESREELVSKMHVRIDEMLKGVLGINSSLMKRLTRDARKMMGDAEMERFFEAIAAWRSDSDLICSIIDCIYAMSNGLWAPQFRRLKKMVAETDRGREDLVGFKVAVVEQIIHER